ncbi:hypothetical protein ES706_00490 [subsurface metagenome]|nr:DUF116 domain-containing protein [Hadesarchaea archaeon]
MPYKFSFDLSRVPQSFFRGLVKAAYEKNMHKRIGGGVRQLAEKLKIRELTGLDISDASMLVEDLVDIQIRNLLYREKFLKTRKRALFLPHCSRKYMDNRCQARFDPKIPSYYCVHCSSDCLINKATALGKERGYDVYVLPGGTCIPQILKKNPYEGVVGVACSQELKEGAGFLKNKNLPGQAVFLIKNGCANTEFNLKSFKEIL